MLSAESARKLAEQNKDKILNELKDANEYKDVVERINGAIKGGFKGMRYKYSEKDSLLYSRIIELLELNGFKCKVKCTMFGYHGTNEYEITVMWG